MSKKFIYFSLSAIAILLAGLFLFFFFIGDLFLTPEERLVKAGKNMTDLDSLTVDNSIKVEYSGHRGSLMALNMDVLSKIDNLQEVIENDIEVSLVGKEDIIITEEFFRIKGGTVLTGDGFFLDLRSFESDHEDEFGYGEKDLIETFESEDLVLLGEGFLGLLEEEGIRFDPKLKDGLLDPFEFFVSALEGSDFLGDVFKQALREEVLKITEKGKEEVRGEEVMKYSIVLDPDKFFDFAEEMMDEHYRDIPDSLIGYSSVSREAIKRDFNNLIEELEKEINSKDVDISGHYYIWSGDKHISKTQLDLSFSNDHEGLYVRWEADLQDINATEANAPSEHKEFKEVIEELSVKIEARNKERQEIIKEVASYAEDHKLKNGNYAGLENDEKAQEMLEDEIFEGVRTRLRSGDPADGTVDHFCVETRIEPLKPWAWDREYLCIDREGEVYENSSYRCGSKSYNSEEEVRFSCER